MSDDLNNDPELEHAMAVLRAATVEPDRDRRSRVYQATQGTGSLLYLWPLAAGVAACFIIGIGVLVFVAIGGGVHRPQIATTNTAPPGNVSEPGGGNERRVWIQSQVDALIEKTKGTDEPVGGSEGLFGGPGDSKVDKVRATVDFHVFALTKPPQGMVLDRATLERSDKTGMEFDVVRIEYSMDGRGILLLHAASGDASGAALSPEGLGLPAVAMVKDGTSVLMIGSGFTQAELAELLRTINR